MKIKIVAFDEDKKDLTMDGTLSLAESFRLEKILKKHVYRFGLLGTQTNFSEDKKTFRTAIQYIVGADAEVKYTALDRNRMNFHLEYGESYKAIKVFDDIQREFRQTNLPITTTEEEYYSRKGSWQLS